MKTINGINYYTTIEICLITNKKNGAVLKYARNKGSIYFEGIGKGKTYYWTDSDLDDYKQYLNNVKEHKIERKETPAKSLMTLYQRKHRAKITGNNEKIEDINKQIREFINKEQ